MTVLIGFKIGLSIIAIGIITNLILVIALKNVLIATTIYSFHNFLSIYIVVCSGSKNPLEGNIILL